MNGLNPTRFERHATRETLRIAAAIAGLAILAGSLPAVPARAASQVVVQRIKGSVAFAHGDSGGNMVNTSAGLPDDSSLALSCETLAALRYPAGSLVEIGGSSRASVPGADTLQLDSGALFYDAHPAAGPFMIKTKAASIAIAGGGGYVIAGKSGVELIVTSGSPTVTSVGSPVTVNAGQMLLIPAVGGSAQPQPATGTNNPALYQFGEDHNPLGPSSNPASDPTGSVNPKCGSALPLLAAGGAAAALIALLDNKKKTAPGTPVPATTPTPTGTATATGATPTPTGSGSATATPSATSSAGGATSTPTGASPTPTGASPTPTATGTIAPLTLSPSAVLLAPAIGSPAAATFTATQGSYTGPFTAVLNCPINIGLSVSVSGNKITVQAPGAVAIGLFCNVVVTGQGGMTASGGVTVTVGILGGGTPTPSPTATPVGATPTPAGTIAPLTLSPSSILLAPAIGQPVAAAFTASQGSYTGPFTATISCLVNLGVTVSVSGNQIIVQAPGTLAAGVLCTVTVTGQGGMTATGQVTVGLGVIGGTPSPTPTPVGATPTPSSTGSFGPLVFTPPNILLAPAIGNSAAGSFNVTQAGYTGPFSATLACAVNIGVSVTVSGNTVTVSVPNTLAVGVLCSVTVTGGGGATGQVPVTITLGVLGGNGTTMSSTRTTQAFGMNTRSITLASGQPGTLDLHGAGTGPFRVDGCSSQLSVVSVNGTFASFVGQNPGVCTLAVRSATGTVTSIPVVVRQGLDRSRTFHGGGAPQLR